MALAFDPAPSPEPLPHVLLGCQGEFGAHGLLSVAIGIEFLAKQAQAGPLGIVGVGEGVEPATGSHSIFEIV